MSRYWVFHDRRLVGPFDADGVARLEGVGLSTLVCPDGGGGTHQQDWQYLAAFPELFGFMGRPSADAHLAPPPEPPVSMAGEAARWMGDVLRKVRRSLDLEQGCALYAAQRLDRWGERSRELAIRLGLYDKRLEDVEDKCRRVARRAEEAEARRREVMRQAAMAAEARLTLAQASDSAAVRKRLLRELIALQKERNEAEAKAARARKRKGLLGGLGKLRAASLKGPADKPKLKIRPLS